MSWQFFDFVAFTTFLYTFFSSRFHIQSPSVKYPNSIAQIKKLFLYFYRNNFLGSYYALFFSICIFFFLNQTRFFHFRMHLIKSFSRSCELISQIRCPDMTQPWSWRKICKYILCFGYCRTNMQHRLPIIDRRWIWQPRKKLRARSSVWAYFYSDIRI